MRRTIITAVVAGLVGALVATPVAVYASHSFSDVSASNTFHADIAWLEQSGVTRGCNPPANTEFCPDDPVTREQMAAFMRRLAQYLGAEDGTPAQADHANTANTANSANNAARLQGRTVTQLGPRAAFNSTDNPPNGQNLTLPTEITAPAPGVLIVSGTVNAYDPTTSDLYSCWLRVNGGMVPGTNMGSSLDGGDGFNTEEDCTTTGALTVDAGTHSIDFEVVNIEATTTFFGASMWVLWVPFDGTGAVPASFTQLGDPDDIDNLIREELNE